MLKQIARLITNNFGLKVLAVFFACVLWFSVINIDDPKITRTFSTTVSVENAEYLTELGKCYEIINNTNTISFKVTGKRSYLERMSNADFKAVADLESIEDMSRVPIEISPQRYAGNVTVASKVYYLELAVEDLVSMPFVIGVQTEGTVAETHALGEVSASPTLLRVSGPKSLVNTIDKVVAIVNVDGMSQDMTDSVIPTLYDENGNKVDRSELTFNVQNVMAAVQILDTKDVTLNFQTSGELPEGYAYVSIDYEPQTVKIKGVSTILNTINSITVPPEVLDLTDATENLEKEVDVAAYLPSGVTLVEDENARIQVTVNIEKHERRVLRMPTANITVNNLGRRYAVEFLEDTVAVEIEGLSSELNKLEAELLTGKIDVGGMKIGEHTVALEVNLEDGFKLAKAATVKLDIVLASDVVNDSEGDDGSQTDKEENDTTASENENSNTTTDEDENNQEIENSETVLKVEE